MADLNKVLLIGNLTRDPEVRTFGDNKVAKFGLAVNNRKKDGATGKWEDEPMFIDLDVWGNLAETAEKYLQKGTKVAVEGRLQLETWTDKGKNEKRSKHKIKVDSFQILTFKDKPKTDESDGKSEDEGVPF